MRFSVAVLILAPLAAVAALDDAPKVFKRSCKDNLGRRFSRYASEASAFCSTFTLSSATAGQTYPSFLSEYATPTRLSSACRCLSTASGTVTTTMSSMSITSTSSKIPTTTSTTTTMMTTTMSMSMSTTTSHSSSSTTSSTSSSTSVSMSMSTSTTSHTSSSTTMMTTTSSTTMSMSSTTSHTSSSTSSSATATSTAGLLPNTFMWTSTQPLIQPKNDSRNYSAIKDPSIIYYEGHYHVFASTAEESGYSLVYMNFTDFNDAQSANFYYLDQSAIGTGYRAAPEIFWFAPQNLWYLVYQNGNAAYSTNPDISNPAGWTAPQTFYASEPAIIQQNIGNGYWVDMWVICDAAYCHLFSSDDNGHLYRSDTPITSFPNGMSDPVIALEDTSNIYSVYEASNVYHITDGLYLLLVEAIGATGQRYFRSWTSSTISGTWTPLAATESNPFLGEANVSFGGGTAWTESFSHGEAIRTVVDQTLTLNPCGGIRYLYQGIIPAQNTGDYNALPWKLALATQTNPVC